MVFAFLCLKNWRICSCVTPFWCDRLTAAVWRVVCTLPVPRQLLLQASAKADDEIAINRHGARAFRPGAFGNLVLDGLLLRGDDILIGYLYLVSDRLVAAGVNHDSHLIVHGGYLLPLLLCLSLDPPVFVVRQAQASQKRLPDAHELAMISDGASFPLRLWNYFDRQF